LFAPGAGGVEAGICAHVVAANRQIRYAERAVCAIACRKTPSIVSLYVNTTFEGLRAGGRTAFSNRGRYHRSPVSGHAT